MKIVCFLRSLGVGGLERQMAGLAVLLKEAGHDVVLMKYLPYDFYREYLESKGVKIVQLQKRGGSWGLARTLAGKVEELGADMVITFAPSPGLKGCYAKLMCHRKFKLIVSERNCLRRFHINDLYRFIVYKFLADCVTSNSHAQTSHIRRAFPNLTDKTRTIVNFVDLDKYTPLQERHIDGPVRIAIVSRVCSRKNTLNTIRTAKELKDRGLSFHITWIGSTREDRYCRRCLKKIEEYGISDVFEIAKASHDVKTVYDSSDVFCLPSFYEGTPNALCEALSSGLPAVCSNVSDNAMYVRPGENGWLFDPKNYREMTETLASVITSDRDTFARYGRRSREIALENFGIDRFRKEYIGLIGTV